MKQLTCEMCGGTDLLKQDGVFVCQSCGMKYSVEEAKKMMIEGTVEVQGAVQVKNSAQLENLLNLAHTSFDSKNYAQAEEFCNQVIAMDALNYDAWKLKGEAINYQINVENQRILEVYNCIMTSYRVLDDAGKEEHQEEILDSLRTCLEGEIDFWLDQFENQRPTNAMLEKVKSTFIDCASKVITSFTELGYDEDEAEEYKSYIKAYFVKQANLKCVATWKSTVYYNYYRDGWDDEFRPNAEILKTYINEGGNLIKLLEFCSEYFSEDVPVTLRATIYENIIFYHEKLCAAKSYKRMVSTTTNGYGAVTNRREYWEEDISPTAGAIELRKKSIAEYREKIVKEFEEDNKDKTAEELLELGREHLDDDEPTYALYRYNDAVTKAPASIIAYLGKAVAIGDSGGDEIELVKQLEKASTLTISSDEKEYVDYLINYKCGESEITLLMYATANLSYTATEFLVNYGVNINEKSTNNVTALWYVARKELASNKIEEGRKIARLLIDKGAELNVKAASGIDLYNNNTDAEIAAMIRAKNPSMEKGQAKASGGGCYVATAVYGSYDCPQVWTLRRYRDYTLAETWYGRAFIHTYYAISPTLVKWFGHTKWFKKMWQGKLDRMVKKLNDEGVKNTPYEDIEW